MKHVVFLRAINVGGRTVIKERLREAFCSLGFRNVSTYKQSGNVIFETDTEDPAAIKTKVEAKLRDLLGYDVAAFVRTVKELKQIIDAEPFKCQKEENASFLITFLPATLSKFPMQLPTTIPKSTAQIISAKETEVFSVTHGGGEGGLPNPFLEAKLKVKSTTRNWNVIREIVEKHWLKV